MCGTQGPGAGPKGPGAGPTRARRWLHKGPALAPQGPGAGPTRSAGAAWGELLRGGGVVTPAHFCPEQVLDEFPGEHAPRLLEAGCSGVECPSSLPQFCASRVHLCVYRCSRAGHESGFLREAGGHVWVGHKTSLNKRPNARIYSATLGPHGPQPHCYRNRMDHIYRLPLGVEFRTGDLCRDGRLVLNAPNVSISGQNNTIGKVLAPGAECRVGTPTCTTDRFLTDLSGFFAIQPYSLGVPGFRERHWNERESARPDVTTGPTLAPSLALKSTAFGENPYLHVGIGRRGSEIPSWGSENADPPPPL
eukprot:gene25901-biopygen12035